MATAQVELRRHYRKLSEKDTDAVVQTVADLIVSYLKQAPVPRKAISGPDPTTGADAPEKETLT